MNWLEALQVFVKVAEKKSFIGAATALHMPTSKVTKLVQSLERQLKTVLFVRTTRQVSLTEQGKHLFQRADSLLNEWHALHASITDHDQTPGGLLTIAALPDVLTGAPFMEWLMQFLNMYPGIRLQIMTIHKPFAFTHSEADLFIGRENYLLDTSDVISKKIMPFYFGAYASPEYLKNHKEIKHPSDLAEHNCLTYTDNNEWEFTNGKQIVKGNYIADSSIMLLNAAMEGIGVVRSANFRAKCYVDANKLTPILEKYTKSASPCSCDIYYKKMPYQPQKIKLFVEHILKQSKAL